MSPRMRTSALALLIVAPLGCAKAKGVDVDPVALIPAEANAAFGFRLDPLKASPVGALMASAARSDSDLAAAIDAMTQCEFKLDGLTGFAATDMNDDEERVLVAVNAPGLGDEDLVRCLEKEANKATGDANGLILFETRGDVRITPQEGGGHLIILNKDTLVIVDKIWEAEVFAAIENPASRITDSDLAKSVAAVDSSADAWFAMTVSESDRAGLTDVPGADGLTMVNAVLDVDSGLAVDLDMGFAAADKADSFRTGMSTLLEEVKPEVAQMGVPQEVLDSVKFAGEGTQVTASAKMGNDALPQLVETMGALMAEP